MRRITTALLLAVLGLGTFGCGSSQGGNRIPTGSIPTGSQDLVLRVDTRGGFTSAGYQLGIVPELSVFGDGRVVVTGPITEQYPPHALPNLLTGRLSRTAVVDLVQRAEDAGLLGAPIDFGRPGVTDMPTTTVSLVPVHGCGDGASCPRYTSQRAYAMDFTPVEGDPGLSAAQRDARRRLRAWVAAVNRTATRTATEPYVATEVAVYARPADAAPAGPDAIEPGHADWPLGDLATTGAPIGGAGSDTSYRCAVLRGSDAARVLDAAAAASSITRWRSAGLEYTIVWRPLLPDEHACPGIGTGPRL